MKYTRRTLLKALTTALGAGAVSNVSWLAAEERTEQTLTRTLQEHQPEENDTLLWYNQPAREWLEALPIGNGRLGAMVFGGVSEEKLQLNESTLWAGGPHDYTS